MAPNSTWTKTILLLTLSASGVISGLEQTRLQPTYIDMMEKAFGLQSKAYVDQLKNASKMWVGGLSWERVIQAAEDILEGNLHLWHGGLTQEIPSAMCINHTIEILMGLTEREIWALLVLDAAGKPGPWLAGLQLNWLGSYSECLSITPNETEVTPPFKGRYCTAIIPQSPGDLRPPMAGMPTTGIRIGLCVPDSCSGLDVTVIINSFLQMQNISQRIGLTLCQDETVEYDTKAIAVLCICAIFVLVLATATVYDILVVQMPKWAVEKEKESLALQGDSNSATSVNTKQKSGEHTPLLPDHKKIPEDVQIGLGGQVLLSFSVYTNTLRLLNTKQSADSVQCIHGIRFISMTWVILGHTLVYGLSMSTNYATYSEKSLKKWTFQAITSATLSVDTFFMISGLLVTYLILKELKIKGRINWFMFYFHRFWRLTPAYMLIIMVYVPLFRYWGDGPMWPQNEAEIDNCETWWTNLLYVNNFVKTKKMCIAWSWYLANDMQFYILSPLIFVPLFYSKLLGMIALSVFFLATTITTGTLARTNNYPPSMFANNNDYGFFLDFYIKPYCRMGPYIVGMATGYIMYITECKIRLPKVVNLLGWAIATASALAVVYGLHDVTVHPLTADVAAFYNAVHRSVWGMAVSWVVFACATGHGGFVNSLLSWPAIVPLSRLTYCAYLVHPIVMNFYYFGRETLFYLSDVTFTFAFFSYLVAAYAVAFVVSLAFESPMMGLEKVLLKRGRRS